MSQNNENNFHGVDTVFKYNGHEYDFDTRDAAYQERFENAVAELQEAEKNIPKDGKPSAMIRAHCKMIKDFFDSCLGKDAGKAVCGEKENITAHYDAYDAFLSLIRSQRDDILNSKNKFVKYSNRQQRRAAKK